MNKKGVSLLILIISVIVLSILVTVSITGINGAITSAKKVTFTKELLEIKENIVNKLLSKEDLNNFANTSVVYSKTTLSRFLTGEKKTQFDNFTSIDINDLIYKIDLKKLGVTSTKKGIGGKNGADETDFYYVQMSQDKTIVKNIIYPKGIKVNNKYYFTLTNDLLEESDLGDKVGETVLQESGVSNGELELVKINTDYTNELAFKVYHDDQNQIANLNISDVNANNYNCTAQIKDGITIWNKDTFRNLDISGINNVRVKLSNSSNTNLYTVADISNLDVEAPVITSANVNKNEGGYEVKVVATDDKSGIKNYRIVPTLKTGNIDYYELDKSIYTNKQAGSILEPNYSRYIKTYGEKFESNILHLPEDAIAFGIAVEDKAGNITVRDFKI